MPRLVWMIGMLSRYLPFLRSDSVVFSSQNQRSEDASCWCECSLGGSGHASIYGLLLILGVERVLGGAAALGRLAKRCSQ